MIHRSKRIQQLDQLWYHAQGSSIEAQVASMHALLRLSLAEHLIRKHLYEQDISTRTSKELGH